MDGKPYVLVEGLKPCLYTNGLYTSLTNWDPTNVLQNSCE